MKIKILSIKFSFLILLFICLSSSHIFGQQNNSNDLNPQIKEKLPTSFGTIVELEVEMFDGSVV
jgi:hypothetical protein